MGLRNRTQQPFWRTTPIRSTDPSALYQHGIECVGKRDGKGMVATGWALCQVAGLHQHQAGDFLTDGYRIWRESPGFDRSQGAAFLADLFGALCSLTPPSVPADIWSASPEAVMPASIYYGTRCWAGNELLEVATDPATKAQYEPLVFRASVDAPHDFVPTRSVDFAKSYAARNGLPEPWVIVLPGQREVVPAGATSGSSTATSDLTSYAAPHSGAQHLDGYAPPTAPPPPQDAPPGPPSPGDGDSERAERERAERERAEREQAAHEQAERERAERERQEQERARAEYERQERERAEQERLERERQERERAEQQRLERERQERERAEQERLEHERQERERAEQERAEQERLERERQERERAEQERQEQERARAEYERQQQAKAERERQERERAERERAERERAERERAEHERQEHERAQQANTEQQRPRPRPTPGSAGRTRPAPSASPTVASPILHPPTRSEPPSWPAPQVPAAQAPAAQAPPAQTPAPVGPRPSPVWHPPTWQPAQPQPQPQQQQPQQQQPQQPKPPQPQPPYQPQAEQPNARPAPTGGWGGPQSHDGPDGSAHTVEFDKAALQSPDPPKQEQPARPPEQHENASSVPPRLADLRSKLMSWLTASYRDVRIESNGWITIPAIGPSVIQIETSIVQGGHLKAEVFAPLVLDVPLTPELLRYVALEGGRFHFGVMSLDAGEDGTDELALLQFSHSLLADAVQRDELLAVVWLIAATLVARAPELQRRFGGVLYAELDR